jgi:single-strand DNA-binding protein
MNINEVNLYGNITKDIELKSLPSGITVASFSIATNRKTKDSMQVEYHNIIAFGKQADAIHQYSKKGNGLYVKGRLQTRSWDGQDGKKIYRTEIIVETFQFGYEKAQPTPQTSVIDSHQNNSSIPDRQEEEINLENIPF